MVVDVRGPNFRASRKLAGEIKSGAGFNCVVKQKYPVGS